MRSLPPDFVRQYGEALESLLGDAGEAALHRAYELGRSALNNGIGLLDIVLAHHDALRDVIGDHSADGQARVARAAAFLAECLSPFEMSLSGYRDANRRLIALNEQLERATAQAVTAAADLKAEMAERQRAEARLRQAQKMEAVGQLTGGIAHDFNNLMTAVIVCLEMFDAVPLSGPQRDLLRAAQRSAARGARLTRQLLAFGRRQTLQLQTVDINQLLKDFDTLLQRAIGEAVELVLRPDPAIWLCSVDHGQFEAALLNLALNARDAMPAGGTLTIETKRVVRAAGEAPSDDEWKPGDYVAVAVADTGVGMSAHVREHAFDPFFTTKGVGKGSGLGLSQVYGFVNQMGGHVTIDSAEGKGTTVTLYLPRAAAKPAVDAGAVASPPLQRAAAGETVLVVEDDGDVRASVIAMLGGLGYQVLTASNGPEAIDILRTDRPIDLLFSDVVMPRGLSGVDVAKEAQRLRAGIKILLTSGYTAEALAQQGANSDFPVFSKPYRQQELADEIRRVLHGPLPSHAAGGRPPH